jgi:hypothetical protein
VAEAWNRRARRRGKVAALVVGGPVAVTIAAITAGVIDALGW